MTSVNTIPAWPTRLLRAASLISLGVSLLIWLMPLNVPGKNLQPFGCGSPSSPTRGNLAKFVCESDLTQARYAAAALLAVSALLLVASELLAPRLAASSAFHGIAAALPLALPVAALSLAALFSPVGTEGSDGSLIRCGTALDPTSDPFMRGACGLLPERQKVLAFGGLGISALLLACGGYVTTGSRRPAEDEPGADSDDGDAERDAEAPEIRRNPR